MPPFAANPVPASLRAAAARRLLAGDPLPALNALAAAADAAAGHLWVGSFLGRKISKVDPATGRVVKQIPSDRLVTGVTWAADELWHGTYPENDDIVEPGELRQIDAESGTVRRRLHLPQGARISGTESDGQGRIWFGNRTGSRDSLCAIDVRG